jgi:hypothetical protein
LELWSLTTLCQHSLHYSRLWHEVSIKKPEFSQ